MASPKPGTPMGPTEPLPPNCSYEDTPAKSFVAFRVVMPEKENSPSFMFNGALSYYTFTLGVGLLILGSILTFVLNDQPRQTYDPFSKNLTVTAILFLVIGSLLITSTIIRCLYPCCQQEVADPITDIKFEAPQETKVQQTQVRPENSTILYNPFYPPVLVPSYSVDKGPPHHNYDFGGESYNITLPNGNVNLLPGTLIYAEESPDKEKLKALESQLMQKLEVPTSKPSAYEVKSNGSAVLKSSGSAIRGREQILQVDDLGIDQIPKF